MGSVLVMIFLFGVMMYFGGMRLKLMGGAIAWASPPSRCSTAT